MRSRRCDLAIVRCSISICCSRGLVVDEVIIAITARQPRGCPGSVKSVAAKVSSDSTAARAVGWSP